MDGNGKNITLFEQVNRLRDFREDLYLLFPKRADAIIDLIDAISSNTFAASPTELSLNPFFQRQYRSVHAAIKNFAPAEKLESFQQTLLPIVTRNIPKPMARPFYLLAGDATSCSRPFSPTLKDRGVQHAPNPTLKNKPITIGHSYSALAALPEKNALNSPAWVIPLLMNRVPSHKKATEVVADQLQVLLEDDSLPFKSHLTAAALDSGYSQKTFLHDTAKHQNYVNIVRMRGNRKFYRQLENTKSNGSKGHPAWYGSLFHMHDPSTWGTSESEKIVPITFKNGRSAMAAIQTWNDMLMRGGKNIPMHQRPFNLLRVSVRDENGHPVFIRPLWLIVMGERRHELSPAQIYDAYRQRYDIEHFFRFGKQKLLLTAYQTSDVCQEENWWTLVCLAYVQLYLMAPLAARHPRPWERYLPQFQHQQDASIASPSTTLRDAGRILTEIGSPAKPPKKRGVAPGRSKGDSQEKRKKLPVIFKRKSKQPDANP